MAIPPTDESVGILAIRFMKYIGCKCRDCGRWSGHYLQEAQSIELMNKIDNRIIRCKYCGRGHKLREIRTGNLYQHRWIADSKSLEIFIKNQNSIGNIG